MGLSGIQHGHAQHTTPAERMAPPEPPPHDVTDDDYKAWQKKVQCRSYAGPQNTHPQSFLEFCQERYPGAQIRETYGHPDDPGFPAVDQRSDSPDDSIANS